MRVQVVSDDVPAFDLRMAMHQQRDVGNVVFFLAGWTSGGKNHTTV